VFTFVIPILLVVNVPARVLARPLTGDAWWPVAGAVSAAVAALVISRVIFQRSLARYRSASS
jgi:ABC-2 type transport system permease protein